jgi:hypothetical protein
MATRIYTGFAPRGAVTIGDRTVSFVRGEPVEVSAEEAALLGDEWEAPKAKKATAKKAVEAEPTTDTAEEATP